MQKKLYSKSTVKTLNYLLFSETYLGPRQTSMMELLVKIVNGF